MADHLTNAELQVAFEGLSIVGTVFASLCALYGVYTVLFAVALWATYKNRSSALRRLRVITISLFVVLTIHFIARAVMYGQRRSMFQPSDAPYDHPRFSIPLEFIAGVTTTLAGLIADGLLAWRFYVIFNRNKWGLYVPSAAVIINALLGFAGDFEYMSYYKDPIKWTTHFQLMTSQITVAWGWAMFATNTVLTGLIIGRIVHTSRSVPSDNARGLGRQYTTLVAASVESAFSTWFGLLLYGIASVAPHGRITTNADIGFVMSCILPIFFGISQTLLIVRLSLSATTPFYTNYDTRTSANSRLDVRVQCEVMTDAKSTVESTARGSSFMDLKPVTNADSDKIAACV